MDSLLAVAERVRELPMLLEEFIARDSKHLGSARGRVRRNPFRVAVIQAAGDQGRPPRLAGAPARYTQR
jgi:hypothetical protein